MSLHSLSGYSIKVCQYLEVHMSLHTVVYLAIQLKFVNN
jgi:hypothetical protein